MSVGLCGLALLATLAGAMSDRLDPGDPNVAALIDAIAVAAMPSTERSSLDAPLGTVEDGLLDWGTSVVIVGRLEQATPVAAGPPGRELTEWFVRPRGEDPVLVLVVGAEAAGFAEGADVQLDARAAGVVEALARNGDARRYAAFVGARPVRPARGDSSWGLAAVLLPTLVALLLLFLVAARLAARARRGPVRHRLGPDAPAADPDAAALPEDPVEALEQLRQRAEGG